MSRRLKAEATAQAGPTAYRDGLRWAYERRPRAWRASRRLSGSTERDLRHACVPSAAARGGFRAARRVVLLGTRYRRTVQEVQGNDNTDREIELPSWGCMRVQNHRLEGVRLHADRGLIGVVVDAR